MNIPHLFATPHSRRDFLRRGGSGLGMIALAGLMQQQGLLATSGPDADLHLHPLAPRAGHSCGKAKSVIWLFMNGGPSQVDTWDYKPELAKSDGKELKGFDKDTGFFTDQVGPLDEVAVRLEAARPIRNVGAGHLSQPGAARR